LIKKYTYLAFYQEYKICKEDKGGGFLVKSGSKDKKKYSVCVWGILGGTFGIQNFDCGEGIGSLKDRMKRKIFHYKIFFTFYKFFPL
jgi:hypothetical protein